MSIQYSGSTLVNATWTATTGTRGELADQINTQLVAAGWTSVTNATSDYTLTSATTPQGLKCKVRVLDPGSGNCAQLKFSDGNGANTQTNFLYLLPAAAQAWKFIANKYQFFVKVPGACGTRQFACGGVPWVPSFLSVTQAGWCHGNAISDTDVVNRTLAGFHGTLGADANAGTGSQSGNVWGVWNSTAHNATAQSNAIGSQRLLVSVVSNSAAQAQSFRWADNTLQVIEPMIVWGNSAVADEPLIRGQLWDAVIVQDSFAADTQISFDGHTYQAITNNNNGSATAYPRGTLFVAVT